MKITQIDSQIALVPAEESLAGGPAPFGWKHFTFVALRMRTDQGVEGIGYTFFGGPMSGALKTAVDELGRLIIGDDPMLIEAIHDKLHKAAGASAGPGGIYTLALAALDIALWDIKGKALELPVWKLAGGFRNKVPTYASGALMRDYPLDWIVKAAQKLHDRGFRQMKTQLALPGATNQVREVEQIKLIREVIGYETDLMCDINQRWDVRQAISIGAQLEEYRLFWLEDVVAHDDYPGLARVADALATPVAAGEYVYGMVPFRHMLEARSVDIAMIDVMRSGGITPWLKIAAMAEAFNVPVVSHLYPEVSVHLVGAIRNGLTVEFMPWTVRLFEDAPQPVNGMLTAPDKPGLGVTFDRKIVTFA